jgi:probable HAF family extracellular repeat protein
MPDPVKLLLAAAIALPACATPMYYVTNLGSFGGDASVAYAISAGGSVAGMALSRSYEDRAFLCDSGSLRDLEGGPSQANSLNSSGAVAGTSYAGGRAAAVVWNAGVRTVLGTLGGAESEAMGINAAGVVVGRADTAAGQGHAFRWQDGVMEDLGALPGGSWSSAYAVNDQGQIVGYGMTGSGLFRAFQADPGLGLIELGTLGGGNSYALGINAAGQVVGHASTAAAFLHAYLYSAGRMLDLGTLGGPHSYAYGINGAGDVVGHSWLAGSLATHAFLYRDGRMTDLNTLIDPACGWELLEAYGINDSGQIVGLGLVGGRTLAYRLDPILTAPLPTSPLSGDPPLTHNPEPGTESLLGLGLLAVAAAARRSKRRCGIPQDSAVGRSAAARL